VSGSISQLTSENVEGEDGDPDGDRDGNGNGNGRWYVGAGEINIWMRANCRRFIDYAGEAADANPTCITEGSTTHHSIPFYGISPHDFAHLARLCNRGAQGHCDWSSSRCLPSRPTSNVRGRGFANANIESR